MREPVHTDDSEDLLYVYIFANSNIIVSKAFLIDLHSAVPDTD